METSGVKSIKSPIDFRFGNHSLKDIHDVTKVNSIYGVNGSGKSAVVLSIQILIGLLQNPDFLAENKRGFLKDIINFDSKKYCMNITFLSHDEEKISDVFRYDIAFSKKDDGFLIEEESLGILSEGKKEKTIYSIKNGQFLILDIDDEQYRETIIENSRNLLTKSTLLSLHPELQTGIEEQKCSKTNIFSYGILNLFYFSHSMAIFTDGENIPHNPDMDYESLKNYAQEKINNPDINENINQERIRVSKKDYGAFEISTHHLTEFIQLFKPELKGIILDKKEFGENDYLIERIFDYGGSNKINQYLESSGIRRICKMFNILSYAAKGGIVFIDELDASISGIYLSKLLEYLLEYSKGQLCFTCHNTFLMSVLKKQKYGIDFISPYSFTKTWTKNAHYTPEKQFTEGFIPGFPVNAIDLDFMHIFPAEDSENGR